jgi:predicted nucleic acid-binding protein
MVMGDAATRTNVTLDPDAEALIRRLMLVNDAHLAARPLECGAVVISFDRDFQRFNGVRSRISRTTGPS